MTSHPECVRRLGSGEEGTHGPLEETDVSQKEIVPNGQSSDEAVPSPLCTYCGKYQWLQRKRNPGGAGGGEGPEHCMLVGLETGVASSAPHREHLLTQVCVCIIPPVRPRVPNRSAYTRSPKDTHGGERERRREHAGEICFDHS